MSLTVLQLLPALDAGGVERGTVEVAEGLVRAGHRALVVSAGGRLVDRLTACGAEHIAWPVGRKSPASLRWVPVLAALMRERGVDVLHLRSRLPAWLGWLAWRSLPPSVRPRLVTTVHGPYTVNAYSTVMLRGERIIAISRFIRDYVLEHHPWVDPARIEVIHRGIDPREFPRGHRPDAAWWQQLREQIGDDDAPLVTLPARLTRWKGQLDFLEVMVRLLARGVRVTGIIAGGASARRRRYRDEVATAIVRHGLTGRVHLIGHRDDLREVMAASAVVLSLARTPEAFGRTTLEALALGVPVVGYDHGGAGEVLRSVFPDGCCPPGDVDAVAARVAEVLARRPTVPPFHAFRRDAMVARTITLYERLAGS